MFSAPAVLTIVYVLRALKISIATIGTNASEINPIMMNGYLIGCFTLLDDAIAANGPSTNTSIAPIKWIIPICSVSEPTITAPIPARKPSVVRILLPELLRISNDAVAMNTPARKIVELKINEDGWWTVTSDVGTGRIDIGARALTDGFKSFYNQQESHENCRIKIDI